MSGLLIRRNADGTVTVRVGRAREHIGTAAKTRGELFDAVKWAAWAKGAVVEDATIAEALFEAAADRARST